jgi:hypothetical protein
MLNAFNLEIFLGHKAETLGLVVLVIWLLLTSVILMNFIIAVLSFEYEA